MAENKKQKEIRINIGDNKELVVEQNLFPYDQELTIYVATDGIFSQDLVRVSPEYNLSKETDNENLDVVYDPENINIKVWSNVDDEDFDREYTIPVYQPIDD